MRIELFFPLKNLAEAFALVYIYMESNDKDNKLELTTNCINKLYYTDLNEAMVDNCLRKFKFNSLNFDFNSFIDSFKKLKEMTKEMKKSTKPPLKKFIDCNIELSKKI